MCLVKNSIKKYLLNKHPALYLLYSNPFSIFLKWDNSLNLLESFLNKEKSSDLSQPPKFNAYLRAKQEFLRVELTKVLMRAVLTPYIHKESSSPEKEAKSAFIHVLSLEDEFSLSEIEETESIGFLSEELEYSTTDSTF